jgi:hypothetical protein
MNELPFTPPFRVISDFCCGTDAHIVDAANNVVVETSCWQRDYDLQHLTAMELICETLNEKFKP